MASRLCWYCGLEAHMSGASQPQYGESFTARAYTCDSCGMLSFAVYGANLELLPIHFEDRISDCVWYPQRPRVRQHVGVSVNIGEAASEAYRCHQFGAYRAAALMARSVVESIAKDQGITSGNLKAKIDQMVESRILPPFLGEAAHEIRFFGNEMAHGDFIEKVSEEECDDVLSFMETIIETVYEQPLRLRRVQEARQRRLEKSQ